MLKIMLLRTGNSCRSQMTEGFARKFGKDLLEVCTAPGCWRPRFSRARVRRKIS
jgi:hypothetical protein